MLIKRSMPIISEQSTDLLVTVEGLRPISERDFRRGFLTTRLQEALSVCIGKFITRFHRALTPLRNAMHRYSSCQLDLIHMQSIINMYYAPFYFAIRKRGSLSDRR